MTLSERATGQERRPREPVRDVPGEEYGLVVAQTSFAKACRGAHVAAITEQVGMPSPMQPSLTRTSAEAAGPSPEGRRKHRRGGLHAIIARFRTRLERKVRKALLQAGVVDLLEATLREVRALRLEIEARDSKPQTGVIDMLEATLREVTALRLEIEARDSELRKPLRALVPIRTPYGHVAVPNTDVPLLSYLISNPDPEAGTCRVLQKLIRTDDPFSYARAAAPRGRRSLA